MNQGPIVGDEPCLPVGDVALNVSSSKFDDVVVNASKVYFSMHLLVAYFLLCLYTFLNFHAHQCALHVHFLPHTVKNCR